MILRGILLEILLDEGHVRTAQVIQCKQNSTDGRFHYALDDLSTGNRCQDHFFDCIQKDRCLALEDASGNDHFDGFVLKDKTTDSADCIGGYIFSELSQYPSGDRIPA